MHEAEISPSDEITANGQTISLDGFRLAAGLDAAALRADAAAAPLIEQEYSLQAERFAAAPNGDVTIGSDGSVRWRGAVIARLKAEDDILHPGFILLADSFLTAEAREKVETRLARFIAFHFETACKPLYDLANAEALFEKPRAVAEKMVERLGIVPRRDIAARLRELDQESRAALRRLGVRFGVYHIFAPLLLKPAAAAALTLLWALKNDALERPGYGDVVSYLAAGRTSFAVNPEFDRQFYRLAGYRILGSKAVRVDMLERCADLIRQATSWTPAGDAARPAGAYDGRSFTISQAMLSILGITPDDMEEVLKQLGYVPQPIPLAEYEAFMAQNTGKARAAAADNAAGGAVPPAEPVGDWPAKAAETAVPAAEVKAEAKAEIKAETVKAERLAAEVKAEIPAAVAAAEPVGDWAAEAETGEDGDKELVSVAISPVLLWHYQKRNFKKPQGRDFTPRARAEGEGNATGKPHYNRGQNRERGSDKESDRGRNSGGESRDARRREEKFAPRGERRERDNRREGGRPPRRDGGKSQPKQYSAKPNKPINVEDSPFAALLALRGKLGK